MITDRLKGAVVLPGHGVAEAIAGLGRQVSAFIVRIRQAARERAQLLALNERELQDIGITRVDALRVAERPLWRFDEPVESPRVTADVVEFYRRRGQTLRLRAMGESAAGIGRFAAVIVRRAAGSGPQRMQREKRP